MGVKICQGCPDRFEGCVQLADDQTLPLLPFTYFAELAARNYAEVMLKAGWRKVVVGLVPTWLQEFEEEAASGG